MEIIQRFEPGQLDAQTAKFLDNYNSNPANNVDIIPEEFIQGIREIGEHLFLKKIVTTTPDEMASIKDLEVSSKGGRKIRLRIYHPSGEGPFPLLFFIHGGGWCVGSIETHDALVRSLANKSGSIAISVGYSLAPEHQYPAALEDVEVAYQWVLNNLNELKANGKIAFAGDSAGGNLATCLAMKCRNEDIPQARFQLLIYPATDLVSMETASHKAFKKGYYLTEPQMKSFRGMYLSDQRDAFQDYISPLLSDDLRDLPPAIICTAEYDPLRDEGEAYALRLQEAGVPVHCIRYNGMIHAFLQMERIISKAITAQEELALLIKAFFNRY